MGSPTTLIFIGNGFDCALGYPTSYKQFFESKNFQELPDGNLLVQHIKRVKAKTNRWSDLEELLSYYSNGSLDLVKTNGIERFKGEYQSIQTALYNYLASISEDRSDEQERFIPMGELVNTWLKEDPCCRFYSFNYTLFLERLLRFIKPDEDPYVIHLHGRLSEITKGEGLVIGIDKNMETHEGCGFLYKANQESYNNTGIKSAVQNAKRLIFFGCSMGISDAWYFNMIFQNSNINIIEIYGNGMDKKQEFNSIIENFSNEDLDDYKEHTRIKYYDSSVIDIVTKDRSKFNLSHPEYLQFLQ